MKLKDLEILIVAIKGSKTAKHLVVGAKRTGRSKEQEENFEGFPI